MYVVRKIKCKLCDEKIHKKVSARSEMKIMKIHLHEIYKFY